MPILNMSQVAHRLLSFKVLMLTTGTLALLSMLVVGREYMALLARAENRVVEVSASYTFLPTLEALVHEADAVIAVKVEAQGGTRMEAQPAQVPQAPTLAQPRRSARSPVQNTLSLATSDTQGEDLGMPVTDYTVRVTRVLQGVAAVGSQVHVAQPGGTVELPTYPGGPKLVRTFVFEHDPLLMVGDEHVLFLKRKDDGSYFVVGGPQGRFPIVAGFIKSIDRATPLLRTHSGETLDAFAAEVQAIKK